MKLGVGLAGYGVSGSIFHGPLLKSHPGFKVLKVFSTQDPKVAGDFPEASCVHSFEKLLEDPQINLVVITTPNTTHFPFAREALKAGKHVVLEKPFVVNTEEGRKLIDLAKIKNRMLTVFQNRRWDSDFLELRQKISEGSLGEISLFESHFDRFRPVVNNQRWREQATMGSGILFDLGSHLIDQTLQLFGKPDSVSADVETQRKGALVDDYFHLIFKYKKMRAILHSSCLVKEPGPRFAVHGTKGSFIKFGLDPQEEALRQGQIPANTPFWGYRKFYDGVLRAIVEGLPAPVTAEEALATIGLIEKCR